MIKLTHLNSANRMTTDILIICLIIFIFTFGYSLHLGLEFSRELNAFSLQFHIGMTKHTKIDFSGPKFNWQHFFVSVFIANLTVALAQFSMWEPNEKIRYVLFFVHYPIFIVWIIEHIMILRGEALVESLRDPWQV